jgi:leader peptidase (prepilin peptidase)/N-methyltransferase
VPSLPQLVALIPALYLLLVAIPLTVIDLREHRLPNRLVLPVFPIALTAQGIAIALGADWASLGIALAVSVAMFIAGILANYFEWLGMGDVKLASAITLILAFFSPLASLVAIGLAFVLAFAVIIFKLARGKANLGQSIPLGPYMLLSFLIALSQSVVTSLA